MTRVHVRFGKCLGPDRRCAGRLLRLARSLLQRVGNLSLNDILDRERLEEIVLRTDPNADEVMSLSTETLLSMFRNHALM
jgi:hypothetical protein